MKTDDSSLDSSQYDTVHEAARKLLDRAAAWDRLPTPVDDLLAAANLKVAPLSAFDEGNMLAYRTEKPNFLSCKAMGILQNVQ